MRDEIDDYIAAFSDEERQEYVAAETALDLACMLYHIRQEQGLTQRKAAERAGLKQQAIGRLANKPEGAFVARCLNIESVVASF